MLGLDDVDELPPVGLDAGEDIPEDSISSAEGRFDRIALKDFDLMAQGHILEDQGFAGFECREQYLKS